ncbi:MAG TPA: peptide-methionine (S)-S-oxide reductase MsrA [Mesorhizobium sp.]|jgi:peptide-methionine (S)-S-oxide reductase|nr:peptide-methionine (S)-S-oxide reductase MsrA [Mesorhizobium sp.]
MIRQMLLAAGFALSALAPAQAATKTAIFAGGCFWCVESDFDHVPGVLSTTSGYIGGENENPTYENHPGHVEAVKIEYDDAQVSYDQLLDVFWRSVDPTDAGGQFCDRGHSYTTGIFAVDEADLKAAEASKAEAQEALGQGIVTPISAAPQFWPAEDYHQDYYKKNPLRYRYYRGACGRDDRVEEVWGEAAHQGIPGY